MGKPIRNVTIVGGGTAGWLTAIKLQHHAQNTQTGKPNYRVSLIESPNIPTVGVGEATVPGMPLTLRKLGLSERRFMKECNASFKLAVLFGGWNNDAQGNPITYANPFASSPSIGGADIGWYWNEYGAGNYDYVQCFTPCVDLARAHKGPRPLGVGEFDNKIGFAYHLDAGKFANLLKEISVERGVEHIVDNMLEVKLDERGYVSSLELEKNGHHPIEFVIDCTGFRGLITTEALKTPFLSYSKYLANDRAMAVQIPHPDEKLEPMTRSTALGAGWSWRVPLFNRIGTGYVFSSAHRNDEEARDEFVAHLGGEKVTKGAEPRIIPMRIGRTEQAWVKNCVSIGLSGGFIEPLESTAIHMIDTGIKWLTQLFPDSDFAEPTRARYNKLMTKLYDEVRDFICLHYALGNRTDTQYWIDARENLEIPDSLAENLELWQHKLPGPFDIDFPSLFPSTTYQAVLLGKRVYETGYGKATLNHGGQLDPKQWKKYIKGRRENLEKIVSATADHRTLLKELRGELEPSAPWAGKTGAPATVALPGRTPNKSNIKASELFDTGDDISVL